MRTVARTIRIGVIGPIGCGKSQVGRWLAERGARVVDADRVAREVTAPGTPVHAAILGRFGASVTAADGTLDRAALGRLVFADPAALRDLEALVHPAVRPRILDLIAAAEADTAPAVVIEAIKLVEGGLAQLCDEVWLVTCDPAVQRARLLARGTPGPEDRPADRRAGGDDRAAPAVRDPRAGHVRRGGGDPASRGGGVRGRAGRHRLSRRPPGRAGGLGRAAGRRAGSATRVGEGADRRRLAGSGRAYPPAGPRTLSRPVLPTAQPTPRRPAAA